MHRTTARGVAAICLVFLLGVPGSDSRGTSSSRQLLGAVTGAPADDAGGISASLVADGAISARGSRRRPSSRQRSIDGSGNNLDAPTMGQAGTPLLRTTPSDYGDGLSAPAGSSRPGARALSNEICEQPAPALNALEATDFLWQWGQFVDHDIDLTGGATPAELLPIPVPQGDPDFDPFGTGTVTIGFGRSLWDPATGTTTPREQINQITAWIDASNVYGSDDALAEELRTMDGTGRLKVSWTPVGELLPDDPAGGTPAMFIAGDERANEQVGLTSMHTLFVREHNRLAERLADRHRHWSGEKIYQRARLLVGAMMQAVTYNEFLPALLGEGALPPYTGYRPDVDAGIANVFSTASYRFGHSALSPELQRIDAWGDPWAAGPVALRDAFFNPDRIRNDGIEPYLRGLAWQQCQTIDSRIIDDVRNFLFGPPGQGGFDLAALNIQRGRDHGLPDYNSARAAYGLDPVTSWTQMTGDLDLAQRLSAMYGDVNNLDIWVGALSEDPLPGSHLGELNHTVVADQFLRLRDGDRFWYQRALGWRARRFVERSTLAEIIRRNTSITDEIQDDVFHMPPEVELPWWWDWATGGQP